MLAEHRRRTGQRQRTLLFAVQWTVWASRTHGFTSFVPQVTWDVWSSSGGCGTHSEFVSQPRNPELRKPQFVKGAAGKPAHLLPEGQMLALLSWSEIHTLSPRKTLFLSSKAVYSTCTLTWVYGYGQSYRCLLLRREAETETHGDFSSTNSHSPPFPCNLT